MFWLVSSLNAPTLGGPQGMYGNILCWMTAAVLWCRSTSPAIPVQDGHIRVGKLNLVDLAGSERQSKTGATGMHRVHGQVDKQLSGAHCAVRLCRLRHVAPASRQFIMRIPANAAAVSLLSLTLPLPLLL